MLLKNYFLFVSALILVSSCGSKTIKQEFKHDYIKYWDLYTVKQLEDSLYADTLKVGKSIGDDSNKDFYLNSINQLITDLKDDRGKTDSLYPMKTFSQITIRRLPIGFKKAFTNQQAIGFLKIINNPLSFDFSETTYEQKFKVDFLNADTVIASLTLSDDISVINTNSEWPKFKKMKFGALKSEPRTQLKKLLNEMGL